MGEEVIWSRMNLKEVLPELPSQLALSVLLRGSEIWREQYRRMGINLPEDEQFIRIFYGRPYFNTNIFLKLLSDFGGDPEFMERSLGGFQMNLLRDRMERPSFFDRARKMAPVAIRSMLLLKDIDKISKRTFSVFEEKYREGLERDFEKFSDDELLDYLKSLEDILKENEITMIIGAVARPFSINLRASLDKVGEIGDVDSTINLLMTGLGNIISANQNLELMRLAQEAKSDRQVLEILQDSADVYDRLKGTKFRERLDNFLKDFGHRGLYEADFESPKYYEDPRHLISQIKEYIDAGLTNPEEIRNRQRKLREEALEMVLKQIEKSRFSFLKKKVFLYNLEKSKKFVAMREENRHYVSMMFALVRRVDLEVGRRFAKRGILGNPHDIFMLTVPEIESVLRGEWKDFRVTVEKRKSERERNAKIQIPDVIVGTFRPGEVEVKRKERKTLFRGYAASPGTVRGKARILRSPEDFKKFQVGDILVAPATDPMWTPLFLMAKAVVTEMGGIASHASIVAREYGVPCVVNVQGIVGALKDGDMIEVDGKAGRVKIIPEDCLQYRQKSAFSNPQDSSMRLNSDNLKS
jgi:pyruvate,water dikinase